MSFAVAFAGCASSGGVATPGQIADRLEQQTGHRTRPDLGEPALPPGVSLDDGLTGNEAVALALWNNTAFQESVADLGIARADLAQAGLLRNPVLTLILPWGPKQLEATAKLPLDAIWQRPKRIAAARTSADAVAERLVATGLTLVADAKLAFVDLTAAQSRSALAAETASLTRRVAALSLSRFDAGDISRLEADTVAADASRAEQDAIQTTLDVVLARNRLHQVLGLAERVPAGALRPAESVEPLPSCPALPALEEDALVSRPDLRAAELDIEAAGRRLGWERSRFASFLAVLDANSQGKEGFEMGPGVETDFGLLDRNQPGVLRASADLDRARARYQSTRQQILREVHDADAQLSQWNAAVIFWRDDLLPRLERQAAQTERAYEAGELPYLAVLDALGRLNAGRTRELEAAIGTRRALARLEYSVGRNCPPQL